MKKSNLSGRLRVIEEMGSKSGLSLSVGSKSTRMTNVNIDIDSDAYPDIVADARSLPFRRETFDSIYFTDVIEHLPKGDEPLALEEIHRVLRKGGELILTTPNHKILYTYLDLARYIMAHRHYKIEDMRSLIEQCKFEIEDVYTRGRWWDCMNNLWYCLVTYPLKRILNIQLPYAPLFMQRLADKEYDCNKNGRGYTIFVQARKRMVENRSPVTL